MSKYDRFTDFLAQSDRQSLRLTFAEMEAILGFALPKSKIYPAWWSNNTSNNVMTSAWLAAGYKSENVDTQGEKITFTRNAVAPAINTGHAANPLASPFFGSMKGTTIVQEGVDLTAPADPSWGNVYRQTGHGVSEEAEEIRLNPTLNVSQKIRALAEIGVDRAEIAKLLGKRYQHVRNVLVDAERRAS